MKKTMIIALLAVLVLGAFTACNGDVNAELAGKRTITLEIPSGWVWSFDGNGTKTKVVEVPADCDTWAKLLDKVTISIIKNDSTVLTLQVYDNEVYFVDTSPRFGLIRDASKISYPETTSSTEMIVLGGTYVLTSAST